jgi:hypothetical protein
LPRTRGDALSHYGYDAQAASWPEAESPLRTPQFDLIIVSAFLTNHEKEDALALTARATPTIVLPGLTPASELLRLVAERLSQG